MRVRRSTSSSRPAARARGRARAGAGARSAATPSPRAASSSRGEQLGVDPVRYELVTAGKADGRRFRDLLARRQQRVDARQQPFSLRAAGRVAKPLGREEGRSRERRQSRRARYERLGNPGSNPWTTSNRPRARASERLARTPTGTPIRLRREIGTAGPMAISSGGSSKAPSSARRPAARSRARFEGARTVTAWPRRRSSRASPSTCSFTSCGCDQANGVTSAIRTSIEFSARRARGASRAG